MQTVLTGAWVFDGRSYLPDGHQVLVEGERIQAVGTAIETAADHDTEIIDLAGHTLLPGFIDAHAHPSIPPGQTIEQLLGATPIYLAMQAVPQLAATLAAGVTTVRDAAGSDAGLKRALAEGLITGPRLLVSLVQISPSGGPNDARTLSGAELRLERPGIPNPVADGPDALRVKVREFVAAGADVIKVFATWHMAAERDGARRRTFTMRSSRHSSTRRRPWAFASWRTRTGRAARSRRRGPGRHRSSTASTSTTTRSA